MAPVHRITKFPRRLASATGEDKIASISEQATTVSDDKDTGDKSTAIEPAARNITDDTIGRFRDAVESIKDAAVIPEPAADEPNAEAAASKKCVVDAADRRTNSDQEASTEETGRLSPQRFSSVAAEEFVLVDSSGERRAALSLSSDGAPALTLSDAAGTARAAVRLNFEGAPSVVLYDAIGRRRLEVALKTDGTTGVGLYDETGEGRAELVVAASGAPSLTLFGSNGRRISKLPNSRER